MEEDGFTLVKGRKNRRRKKTSQCQSLAKPRSGSHKIIMHVLMESGDHLASISQDFLERILLKIESKRKLLSSNTLLVKTMIEEIQLWKSSVLKTTNDCEKSVEIICYGLGSISESITSQVQLSILLQILEDITGSCYAYDPIFNKLDRQILKHYNINEISSNEMGFRSISSPTIFFMPHCPMVMYQNVLAANWNGKSLSELIVIGNRFSSYIQAKSKKSMQEAAPLILKSESFTTEIDILPITDYPNAMNNICIHQFTISKASKTDNSDKESLLDVSAEDLQRKTDLEIRP